jgi:hypothetical protein
VIDPDDACPNEAGARVNGCPASDIVGAGAPAISGNTVVGGQLSSSTGTWTVNGDPLGYTLAYRWQRCATADSCVDIPAATSANYTLVAADKGSSIRVVATAVNADDDASQSSGITAAVTDPPAVPPPPANPLTLTVKKSLGNLTPKKGILTLRGAVVTCAASATGPCRGKATFSTAKSTKYIEIVFMIAPGKSAAISGKVKSAKLKAIKKAKSIKTTVKISVAAPGFAPSTASATATLKSQKK